MQLAKARLKDGNTVVGAVQGEQFLVLDLASKGLVDLSALLAHEAPFAVATELAKSAKPVPLADVTLLHPVDRQEVWAAGVTYKRSKVAREEESVGAAQFYDKVYTAPRPELFLKATPERVSNPNAPIRVRRDATWSVPEPEYTLVISPQGKIVGVTIGNDVSSRDIEGENPLYLPQAKIYHGSCSIGPVITLSEAMPPLAETEIRLVIRRSGAVAFEGTTTLAQLSRTPESLADWLCREQVFPHGVFLLTGTGIVPPDVFNLSSGDIVDITITGIGTLTNPVA
ncbi:MAG: fumarylacetoacetate hydrolase family protein [Fimbriiglobus sp.]